MARLYATRGHTRGSIWVIYAFEDASGRDLALRHLLDHARKAAGMSPAPLTGGI
jgi:hypothetical protein